MAPCAATRTSRTRTRRNPDSTVFPALAPPRFARGLPDRHAQGLTMDDLSLTVRHVDLKSWMAHYCPGEKPAFLFDEIERALHPAIGLDTVGALLAEREAIKARLAENFGGARH